ncbi:hypothetical protein [Methylibium rhizosphaerae]|uniref:hypothetical protein n=1 Tax=Methylibium rhizosphaerae TaxID=2570323 RepID=UPI0011263F19|nr:hypothetical protein [Methylibium rhizosphaerae]
MSSMRQAALTVHALNEADRRWVLEQLPQEERQPLLSLLRELAELGVPPDASLLPAAVEPYTLPPAAMQAPGPEARLERLPPATVAAALRDEPRALVLAVLGCRAWPWRAEVARALAIDAPLAFAGGAERLAAVACRLLADRLDEGLPTSAAALPAEAPAQRAGSWWRGWRKGAAR